MKNLYFKNLRSVKTQNSEVAAVDVDAEAEPEPEPRAEPYDTEHYEADEEDDLTPEKMLVSLFEGILIN